MTLIDKLLMTPFHPLTDSKNYTLVWISFGPILNESKLILKLILFHLYNYTFYSKVLIFDLDLE